MEAIILIGVQGSGKTTFYIQHFSASHVRISRDILKTRHRQNVLISTCLAAKQPFVVDNTNFLRVQRADIIGRAKAAGFRVIGYYFRCELRDALQRTSQRQGQVIPRVGVVVTYKRLEPPTWGEGFDDLRVVEINAANEFVVRSWSDEQTPPNPV
jgi:predicted kinase